MYGKLIDGNIVIAPNPLHVNRGMVYNPSGYIYESVGYKPIIDTPQPEQPEDGSTVYYTSHWEEQDGQIVRVWEEAEPPEPEAVTPASPTLEERLTIIEDAFADLCKEVFGDG